VCTSATCTGREAEPKAHPLRLLLRQFELFSQAIQPRAKSAGIRCMSNVINAAHPHYSPEWRIRSACASSVLREGLRIEGNLPQRASESGVVLAQRVIFATSERRHARSCASVNGFSSIVTPSSEIGAGNSIEPEIMITGTPSSRSRAIKP
jgi:hypothetical protein